MASLIQMGLMANRPTDLHKQESTNTNFKVANNAERGVQH